MAGLFGAGGLGSGFLWQFRHELLGVGCAGRAGDGQAGLQALDFSVGHLQIMNLLTGGRAQCIDGIDDVINSNLGHISIHFIRKNPAPELRAEFVSNRESSATAPLFPVTKFKD